MKKSKRLLILLKKIIFGKTRDLEIQVEDTDTRIKKIKENAARIEFSEPRQYVRICVSEYRGTRLFFMDTEKNKSYFQLTSDDYPDGGGTERSFTVSTNFVFVVIRHKFGLEDEIFAEIEGIPETTQRALSEFLNESVTWVG